MLQGNESVCVVDGDTLEEKNLNRQLFTADDIGKLKALALGEKYECESNSQYFSHGMIELERSDWLLCCVDNNAGRKAVLDSCDAYGCKAIFGANETTSAEAYYYQRDWKDGDKDPRKYYPEILTEHTDDPRHEAIGCTGEIQRANRQLVTANFMAAALMQHLFIIWAKEKQKLSPEAVAYLPHRIVQNLTKYQTYNSKG